MESNTYTYTARSREKPEKMATFTLNNGNISVELGNALLEYLEKRAEAEETAGGIPLSDWAKPVTIGALQKIAQPLPINDFDAAMGGEESLQTTIWLRSGGLRLAPIMTSWDAVDNPVAARAFVEEVNKRQQTADPINALPSVLDYWGTWLATGASLIVLVVMLSRLRQRSDGA